MTYEDLRRVVIDDNILSKPSIRSRQKIWEKLFDRYKFGFEDNLFQLWWDLLPQTEGHDLAQLATLRWAQHDVLLRFLWNEVYMPRRSMETAVLSEDVIGYIYDIKGTHAAKRFFVERSENVQKSIAQHFLLLLRECGGAQGKKKKRFVILPTGKKACRYAVHLAKKDSPGSHEILDHWALQWWGNSTSKADEILRQVESFG